MVDKTDVRTQILYNRVLAGLGLSAFRVGLIQKAHDCLSNLCSIKTQQIREVLAQGQARWTDKDPEQERIERRRQMPYHMHINPDLLDSCYMTCAMLLELPHMARGNTNPYQQYAVSRQFRKYVQNYNRQVFTGPPENTREHVIAASKCFISGDWKRGMGYILGLDVWNLIPNEGGEKVKKMLSVHMKEEAVRTYLLSNGVNAYSSVSLDHICECFEMEQESTRRIISKMIFNKEIAAAWEAGNTLVLNKVNSSQTQILSVKLAERVSALVDSNERLIDPLNGGQMFGRDEWGNNRNEGRRQWNNRGDDGQNQGNRRYQKSGAQGRGNAGGDNSGRGGGRGRGRGGGRGGGGSNYNRNSEIKDRNDPKAWGGPKATASVWGAGATN